MSSESEQKKKWQSPIRLGTVKPAKYIFRDALVVSVITVIVTILIYVFMYLFAGNLEIMQTLGFWEVIAKSFVISMTLNVFYEVGGINAFLCESASRYYTDTALNKYTTRSNAIVDSLSAEAALAKISNNPDLLKIRENQKRMHAMVRATVDAPRIVEFIHTYKEKNKQYPSADDVYNALFESQKDAAKLTLDDVKLLMNLKQGAPFPENLNRLEAVPRLITVLGMARNKDAVKYFIENGFEDLKSEKGRLDLEPLLAKRIIDAETVKKEKSAIQRGMHWLSGIPIFSAFAAGAPGECECE